MRIFLLFILLLTFSCKKKDPNKIDYINLEEEGIRKVGIQINTRIEKSLEELSTDNIICQYRCKDNNLLTEKSRFYFNITSDEKILYVYINQDNLCNNNSPGLTVNELKIYKIPIELINEESIWTMEEDVHITGKPISENYYWVQFDSKFKEKSFERISKSKRRNYNDKDEFFYKIDTLYTNDIVIRMTKSQSNRIENALKIIASEY